MHIAEIEEQIRKYMPVERFIQLNRRLEVLQRDQDLKLKALGELREYYLSAGTEKELQTIKETVGQIREISRTTRTEIRAIKSEIAAALPLDVALELYRNLIEATTTGESR